ncbi:MAG TPA: hypothetical protein VN578_11795 [Candidatus Binatia bacterium]|jgi:hypothetical protein|nr:hypothetical protein [Candidatus Binatia bacterium]
MKQIVLLVAVVLALSGCASRRSPTTKTVRIHEAAPDADNAQQWPLAFKVGTRRFGTLQDFKAFVAALPPGSVVRWNSGCFRYEMIPLAHSEMTIRDFKEYCGQHGVEFQYVSGY